MPSKKGERRKRLLEIAEIPATIIFYESPRRIAATLLDAADVLGDRRAVIAREITKLHEEFSRGTLSELHAKFSSATVKGELVLLIDRVRDHRPANAERMSLPDRLEQLQAEGIDRKAALKKVAKEFGLSKSEAYRIVQNTEK